jgi:hypothetical protein
MLYRVVSEFALIFSDKDNTLNEKELKSLKSISSIEFTHNTTIEII